MPKFSRDEPAPQIGRFDRDRSPLSGNAQAGDRGGDRGGDRFSVKVLSSDKPSLKPDARHGHGWESFQQRIATDKFDRFDKGPVGKEIKLTSQYRLHREGDVARRLGLHPKHDGGPHHKGHRPDERLDVGGIHHRPDGHHHSPHWHGPQNLRNTFRFHHYASLYHGSHCWYPIWSPWVNWSWYYHARPIWDPRPYYCRPFVYLPATRWTYWDYPTWVALSVVPSGTWVDVPQVVVAPAQFDLQLLAVRFVDPGHPEQNLGPRYRVWFRNNSPQAVDRPFDVTLLASLSGILAQNLPQAGVRVTAIGAGETQSVDIRLPMGVYEMGRDAAGKPIPFATLHALVDANREINETTLTNNGTNVPAAEILAVDPAAFEVQPSTAPAGNEILLAGEGFGPEPGRVLVHLGEIEMDAQILGWYDLGVRLALPNLPLAGPTAAELIVVRSDGAAANPLGITITPPEQAR